MASLYERRQKIEAVGDIAALTDAMQTVAASKRTRTQQMVFAGRPYGGEITRQMRLLLPHVKPENHPTLIPPRTDSGARDVAVLFTSNRGLCGHFNVNVVQMATDWPGGQTAAYITFGAMGNQFVQELGLPVIADYSDFSDTDPPFTTVLPAVGKLVGGLTDGGFKEVHLFYTVLRNFFEQPPVRRRLLPIVIDDLVASPEEDRPTDGPEQNSDPLFDLSPDRIFDNIAPQYIGTVLFSALRESLLAEHTARMMAMKQASETATDMRDALWIDLQRRRMARITQEINEMSSAAGALV